MLARGCSRDSTFRISQYRIRSGHVPPSLNLGSPNPTLPTWRLQPWCHVSSNARSFHGGSVCKQQMDKKQWYSLLHRFKATINFPEETFNFSRTAELETPDAGQVVVLHGYLGTSANLSKNLLFVQLISKDRTCSIQLVSSSQELPDKDRSAHELVKKLPMHTPVAVRGVLRKREQPPEQDSGSIRKIKHVELDMLYVQSLNEFPSDIIATPDTVFGPDQRHLQLRADVDLRKSLSFRSDVGLALRSKLHDLKFVDIETPLLFKSTPEGAREFIVPTRRKGFAYALPQSPQQFKQILMASGIPKYYQFARCFRDEDLRADRQPEFTQLDLEMSFVGADQVMHIIEELILSLWSTFVKSGLACPFPRMSYREAMASYGSDKPDTRLGMQTSRIDYLLPGDLTSKISPLQAPIVESLMLRFNQSVPDASSTMQQFVANFLDSAEGTAFVNNPDGGPGIFVIDSGKPLQGLQALGFEAAERVEEIYQIEDGDLIVLQARQDLPFSGGSTTLGNLRLALHAAAVRQGLVKPPIGFAPLWVIDFPLFSPTTQDEPGQGGTAGLTATHHPFTSPKSAEDVDLLVVDPRKVIGDHYDLVINGVELGGGSRRIHSAEMQEFVMRQVLKMSPERVADFSHLLGVLRAGCPPHAGIALGFDRLITLMLGKSSMREVIAFPKTGKGEDALVKSPGPLTDEILKTYFLHFRASDDQSSV